MGYRELTEAEIASMNNVKELGQAIGDFIEAMPEGSDARWVSIGKTHIQQGLMALTRAITKPENF